MDPDFSRLDAYLAAADLDGYLLDAASSLSDQRYLSGFDAPDPFITLYTPESLVLLTSTMEYGRAVEESRADVVHRLGEYDFAENRAEFGQETARAMAVDGFLSEFGVEAVGTNRRFPLFTADSLRERDYRVEPDLEDVLADIRARKAPEEIANIHDAQQANETAMAAAQEMLAEATADESGELTLDGQLLTSERVKATIEGTLLEEGYALDETIVASGPQGADPHNRGHGPIAAGEPVIIDIFPRSKTTKYHGDMTRTFVAGEPDAEVEELFQLTKDAKAAALDALGPGVSGEAVHDAACDVYERAGYPTLRSDETTDTGFIHSTGHGVGLDVHERPRLATAGDELEPGHVVTVEPGLYDPSVGGVRLEDLVVVTEDGYENLTDYPERLRV